MTEEEFAALAAAGYSRIPLHREVLADFDTPLSSYRKLAEGPYSYLFESVEGGEKWGRYSIIGMPCRRVYKVFGRRLETWYDGAIEDRREVDDPLREIEALQASLRAAPLPALPVFHGGLVGFFAYDVVRYVEPRLAASCPRDELGTPDILLMLSDEVLVFDNLAGTAHVVVNADPAQEGAWAAATARLQQMLATLAAPLEPLPPYPWPVPTAAPSRRRRAAACRARHSRRRWTGQGIRAGR
jgi:anthranilate synthase component 1